MTLDNSPRHATLDQWLSWLETLHPTEIELGLERVKLVAERMQLNKYFDTRPTNSLLPKLITIAGTNGKGSTVAALDAMLREAGKTVGSYTSPHLLQYNERVKINGQPASDEIICEAFAEIDKAREDISLTYFEFGTLAAFFIFENADVDYWLLEVGLGGRLDAVNALAPDIAVITSIALDHEAWLGNTRESIGFEKAGILRPHIPFVCAETNVPNTVIRAVEESNCKACFLGVDFSFSQSSELLTVSVGENKLEICGTLLPAPSLAAALQVVALLGFDEQLAKMSRALSAVSLSGRFSLLKSASGKNYWLDVAHNPAAAIMLAARLEQNGLNRINAIVAMMADKDCKGNLEPIIDYVEHWFLIPLENNARAAKPEMLKRNLLDLKVDRSAITECDSFEDARIKSEREPYSKYDALVYGSFFTVAEALKSVKTQ